MKSKDDMIKTNLENLANKIKDMKKGDDVYINEYILTIKDILSEMKKNKTIEKESIDNIEGIIGNIENGNNKKIKEVSQKFIILVDTMKDLLEVVNEVNSERSTNKKPK